MESSRPRTLDEDSRIFDDDDADLTESQEFDKVLALGAESLQKGDIIAARGLLEKALRHKPRNQRARNLLGLTLFKLGELEKAESLYRGLIEDHPADPTLRVNLGLVFLKSNASSDAVRCFETALDLAPGHAKAQNYLGLALAQRGEHARAREWFLKCGNTAMAQRMAHELAASPIRQVAQDAEEALASDRPFSNAVEAQAAERIAAEDKSAEAVAAEPASPAREEPSADLGGQGTPEIEPRMPTPPTISRWVATQPASAVPPPGGHLSTQPEMRPLPRGALGRVAIARRADGSPASDDPETPAPELEPALAPGSEVATPDKPEQYKTRPDGEMNAAAAEVAAVQQPAAQEAAVQQAAVQQAAASLGVQPAAVNAPAVAPAQARTEPHAPATTALSAYTNQRRLEVPLGEGGFIIGPTEIVVQVRGQMLTRLDGLVASWGQVSMKPELKRFRGKATDKPFGEGARRMLRGIGEGRYVISREGRCFTALELGDEPAYFREEILFAFEESLVFENGRVPGKTGSDLHLVHLRGRGKLLLVTVGTPRSVEVLKNEPLRIPMDQLVGWHGPLIQPRLVPIVEEAPEMGVALELSGEGRALVDAPESH